MEPTNFQYPSQQKKVNKMLPMIVVGAVLLAGIIASYLILRQPKKEEVKKDIVVEQKVPTPTEKPKIDKTTVKVQVINGTGTPGQAGVVVKALVDAGYKSDNIKTGNAEKFDNSTTSITARDNFEEIVIDIENALKSTFDKFTVVSPNLDAESEFDIVVVTGGKTFEAPTPTKSATSSVSPTLGVTASPTPTVTSSPTPTPQ